MSIPSEISRAQYTGNGITTDFAFPYKFFEDDDLVVDCDGTVKTLTTHYTVTGAGGPSGGTVTFLAAPIADAVVTIWERPDFVQEADYQTGDRFPAETHENALDLLTNQTKYLLAEIVRSLRIPMTEDSLDAMTKAARSGKLLGFDENGDIYFYSPSDAGAASNLGYVLFANAAARAAATPEFVGQIGVQVDTLVIYLGNNTGVGDWEQYADANSTVTFADDVARAAATPSFEGQLGVQLDTGVVYRSTGLSPGDWTPIIATSPVVTGSYEAFPVVSDYAGLIAALAAEYTTPVGGLQLGAIIEITNGELAKLYTGTPASGGAFVAGTLTTYNPLQDNGFIVIVPRGTGFTMNANTESYTTEGHIIINGRIIADAYPIFFNYRAGLEDAFASVSALTRTVYRAYRGELLLATAPAAPLTVTSNRLGLYWTGNDNDLGDVVRRGVADIYYPSTISTQTSTVTAANDAGNLEFTYVAHAMVSGTAVHFTATGFPGGISVATPYYILSTGTDTFQVEATIGGGAIAFASAGTDVVVNNFKVYLTLSPLGDVRPRPDLAAWTGSASVTFVRGMPSISGKFHNGSGDKLAAWWGFDGDADRIYTAVESGGTWSLTRVKQSDRSYMLQAMLDGGQQTLDNISTNAVFLFGNGIYRISRLVNLTARYVVIRGMGRDGVAFTFLFGKAGYDGTVITSPTATIDGAVVQVCAAAQNTVWGESFEEEWGQARTGFYISANVFIFRMSYIRLNGGTGVNNNGHFVFWLFANLGSAERVLLEYMESQNVDKGVFKFTGSINTLVITDCHLLGAGNQANTRMIELDREGGSGGTNLRLERMTFGEGGESAIRIQGEGKSPIAIRDMHYEAFHRCLDIDSDDQFRLGAYGASSTVLADVATFNSNNNAWAAVVITAIDEVLAGAAAKYRLMTYTSSSLTSGILDGDRFFFIGTGDATDGGNADYSEDYWFWKPDPAAKSGFAYRSSSTNRQLGCVDTLIEYSDIDWVNSRINIYLGTPGAGTTKVLCWIDYPDRILQTDPGYSYLLITTVSESVGAIFYDLDGVTALPIIANPGRANFIPFRLHTRLIDPSDIYAGGAKLNLGVTTAKWRPTYLLHNDVLCRVETRMVNQPEFADNPQSLLISSPQLEAAAPLVFPKAHAEGSFLTRFSVASKNNGQGGTANSADNIYSAVDYVLEGHQYFSDYTNTGTYYGN